MYKPEDESPCSFFIPMKMMSTGHYILNTCNKTNTTCMFSSSGCFRFCQGYEKIPIIEEKDLKEIS